MAPRSTSPLQAEDPGAGLLSFPASTTTSIVFGSETSA